VALRGIRMRAVSGRNGRSSGGFLIGRFRLLRVVDGGVIAYSICYEAPCQRAPVALHPHGPLSSRSALRADCTVLLAAWAHGRTRCAACGRAAQTSGRESEEEARCARRPSTCAARRALRGPCGRRATGARCGRRGPATNGPALAAAQRMELSPRSSWPRNGWTCPRARRGRRPLVRSMIRRKPMPFS